MHKNKVKYIPWCCCISTIVENATSTLKHTIATRARKRFQWWDFIAMTGHREELRAHCVVDSFRGENSLWSAVIKTLFVYFENWRSSTITRESEAIDSTYFTHNRICWESSFHTLKLKKKKNEMTSKVQRKPQFPPQTNNWCWRTRSCGGINSDHVS